ncbi:MAG: ISL3 family transposase [Clostridia bacterium]|nr:ISL3 family transposase [Clostridia bacterium]
MLYKDYTTKLLDMEHMNIRKIEVTESEILLHVDMKRRLVPCPVCGNMTDSVHDYRIQKVKDSPVQGKALVWYYRKRRYVCHSCGKRFLERNWLLPKWHRLTNRLALQAIGKLSDKMSRKDIAAEFHVSESTICRWMNLTEYGRPDRLPPVLSIDEFRGNAGGEKFQCILTSPVQKRILDILPDCRESRIYEYLQQFPNRNEVRYFVSDMRKDYISMAKNLFPNAKIVIDKFHVVRYCTWALENVRKRIQKSLHPDERKYFKRSRTLLLKRMNHLTPNGRESVIRMLRFQSDLRDAYLLKEKFYSFMDSKDSEEARKRLHEFGLFAAVTDLKEFEPLFTVLRNWSKYILNSFDTGYTNGFTEGCNNKIKVLKRIAFGYRNFNNFRQRILMTNSSS